MHRFQIKTFLYVPTLYFGYTRSVDTKLNNQEIYKECIKRKTTDLYSDFVFQLCSQTSKAS